jgi:DNA (cytosine-5)-methyltransferase 1
LPHFLLLENSPLLVGRGLAGVLGDIASLGYDARWGVLGAYHAGAPHARERLWLVAHAAGERCPEMPKRLSAEGDSGIKRVIQKEAVGADADCFGWQGQRQPGEGAKSRRDIEARSAIAGIPFASPWAECWHEDAPRVLGMANGVANRLDRFEAIGNGQVPAVVRLAWQTLAPR